MTEDVDPHKPWNGETERITVRLPTTLLDEFEAAMDDGTYWNLSEAVRDALRHEIRRQED